ncbi:hypothetical protein J1N35_011585 [Gossypium stocksii]|uniref:Uncharacterized protein n=1 Tax=Gossypium stocksii TaxID=47602 RepID=A0A9D4ABL4_9ROSI|nr:hypothetical protein J1N35_011585 [Gossypium stocksii]
MPLAHNYFPYKGDVTKHQVLFRDIEGCVATPNAALKLFYPTPYVETSNSSCCNK